MNRILQHRRRHLRRFMAQRTTSCSLIMTTSMSTFHSLHQDQTLRTAELDSSNDPPPTPPPTTPW